MLEVLSHAYGGVRTTTKTNNGTIVQAPFLSITVKKHRLPKWHQGFGVELYMVMGPSTKIRIIRFLPFVYPCVFISISRPVSIVLYVFRDIP